MEKRLFYKVFVYFLSVSFFFLMSGFNSLMVEAKEVSFPIGEMVSKGTVKFEARENVWKSVEPSNFPIFQGTKIKTEKGMAVIILRNNSQIEVSPDSLFFFDQDSRLILSRGSIEFRIPYTSEISFRVGNISISKSRTLEAAKTPSAVSLKNEETMGTISIHSNGSVTVKSVQGNLSMVNQDRVVLAGLSSKDSVTIPSITVGKAPRVMVAQAGLTGTTSEESEGFLGISPWGWVGIIGGVVVIAAVVAVAAGGGGGGGHGGVTCP